MKKEPIDIGSVTTRVRQICIEDKYSEQNIKEKVTNAVLEAIETGLKSSFDFAVQNVTTYLNTIATHESKQIRINQIKHMSPEDLVIHMFMVVIPHTELTPLQGVVAKLATYLKFDNIFDGIQTASELLSVCRTCGVYTMYREPVSIQSNVTFNKEILDFIEETQYLMPMLCEPKGWTNNNSGGYLSICTSLLLKQYNHHNHNQAYDVINTLQKIEWELDENVMLETEQPKKPLDTVEKVTAWNQYLESSKRVCNNMLNAGNSFWLMWQYDFRGRAYSHGYHINLQSTSYKKAALNFKKKQLITG